LLCCVKNFKFGKTYDRILQNLQYKWPFVIFRLDASFLR